MNFNSTHFFLLNEFIFLLAEKEKHYPNINNIQLAGTHFNEICVNLIIVDLGMEPYQYIYTK